MGVTDFFFFLRYEQLNPKYGVFLQGFSVGMVTFYVTNFSNNWCLIWYHNIAVK